MSSAFQRPAASFAILLFVALVLPLIGFKAYANNQPQLLPIPAQTFFALQPVSVQLNANRIDGQLPNIRLINAPTGATLSVSSDGAHEFNWTPPANVANELVIIVQAYNPAQPTIVSTQRMVLQHGTAEQEQAYLTELARIKAAGGAQTQSIPSAETSVKSDKPDTSILPSITAQLLQVDREFQLFVRPTKLDKNMIAMSAVSLPPGAMFEEAFAGSWLLSWRPDVAQLGKHRVELIAVDASGKQANTEQVLVLTVVNELNNTEENVPIELATIDGLDESLELEEPLELEESLELEEPLKLDEPFELEEALKLEEEVQRDELNHNDESNPDELRLAALRNHWQSKPIEVQHSVSIAPLSAQIVSAGQTIQFKVVPQTSDHAVPILHIDRLPRGGTFDPKKDSAGVRTFHWRTTKADQGQHVFRFTAIHPDDFDVRVSAEVLIVVGNPEVRETLPERTTGNFVPSAQPIKAQSILQQKVATIIDPTMQDLPMPLRSEEAITLSSIEE